MDSLLPVQEAIYAALRNDATIKSLVGNPARVFDHVDQTPEFPYITIGESTAVPFDVKDKTGMEQTVMVHVWDRGYRGRARTKQVMAAAYNVLNRATLTVSGNAFIYCFFEFGDTFIDPDGLTYHGVHRFRIVTTQPD